MRLSAYRALSLSALPVALACSDDPQVITQPGPEDTSTANAGGSAGNGAQPDESAPDELDPMPSAGAGGVGAAGATSDTGGAGVTPVGSDAGPASLPPPPPAFTAPRGGCDIATRVGGFSVEKQTDFGVVQGAVSDGVVPTAIPELVLDQDGCRLLERRNLVCIPACVGAQTCGEDGACIPYPRQVSVGDVQITGLTRETVMSPQDPGNGYYAPGATNPPYAVGSEVVLSAAGTESLATFHLFGVGSEPLQRPPSWVLESGADLALTWTAPTSGVETRVWIELTIDQHGTSPLSLACDLPDTGSATIPAAIIDQLINSGVTGFPNGRITRRTADHVDLDVGCVDLIVGSPLPASVAVAGYTPCNGAEDCPNDQTCNVPLERCE
jgi:hypothetical protein